MAKVLKKRSPELITKFLEAYEQYPCLWNRKRSPYKDRNKRDQALRRIVEDLHDATYESSVRASYVVALEIATLSHSFSESKFVKRCLIVAARKACPDMVEKFKRISLSRRTVTRRIEEMANNVRQQLIGIAQNFIAFSLALDESIDISGTPRLAIIIRGVNKKLEVTEELLNICSIKDRTSGYDIFSCVAEVIEQNNLQWSNLVSVATDGTPAMVDKKIGFVGCLNSKLETLTVPRQVIAINCVIHHQDLCSKAIELNRVMSVVVETTNFIRCHGTNRKHFKAFLEEIDAEYNELPYHSEVRWLSRGNVLDGFFKLREEIAVFMDIAGHPVPELRNGSWINDFAFLLDIFGHLNELNLKLQDKQNTIMNMISAVYTFTMKLELLMGQLRAGDATHFINLQTVALDNDFKVYVNILEIILKEIELRFRDVYELENDIKIIHSPFTVDIDSVPSHLQLELIDLVCNAHLQRKFASQTLLQFYNNLDEKTFPRLHTLAANILAMFGSTYVCEQLFSILTQTKSAERNRISDDNLKSTLRLSTSQAIVPNITDLLKRKRLQKTRQVSNH